MASVSNPERMDSHPDVDLKVDQVRENVTVALSVALVLPTIGMNVTRTEELQALLRLYSVTRVQSWKQNNSSRFKILNFVEPFEEDQSAIMATGVASPQRPLRMCEVRTLTRWNSN